jgi:sugar phosphate isomerase/epimerase
VFGGHTDFTDPRRFWDFRSLGHGDINFEDIIVALNDMPVIAARSRSNGKMAAWIASTARRKAARSSANWIHTERGGI